MSELGIHWYKTGEWCPCPATVFFVHWSKTSRAYRDADRTIDGIEMHSLEQLLALRILEYCGPLPVGRLAVAELIERLRTDRGSRWSVLC